MITILLFSIEIERRLLTYDICNPVHIFSIFVSNNGSLVLISLTDCNVKSN
jgi:hypothetical protein